MLQEAMSFYLPAKVHNGQNGNVLAQRPSFSFKKTKMKSIKGIITSVQELDRLENNLLASMGP